MSLYDEDVRDLNSLKVCVLKFMSEIVRGLCPGCKVSEFFEGLSQGLPLRYSLSICVTRIYPEEFGGSMFTLQGFLVM